MTKQMACEVSELSPNVALRVQIDGVPIAVVMDAAGEIHALGDTCSHGQISLAEGFVEDGTIECWAHGSAFSLKTGVPQNLPAFEPVPVFEVHIENNQVFIDPTVTKVIEA